MAEETFYSFSTSCLKKIFQMFGVAVSVERPFFAFRKNSLLEMIRTIIILVYITHVKNSQLVERLQTSRQQVVFARLVTSCQQVWNKLLTTCNNLVDIVRLHA